MDDDDEEEETTGAGAEEKAKALIARRLELYPHIAQFRNEGIISAERAVQVLHPSSPVALWGQESAVSPLKKPMPLRWKSRSSFGRTCSGWGSTGFPKTLI